MSLSVCHDSVKYVTHCPFPRLLADRVHNLTAIILDTEFAEYHGPPVTLCLFHICPQRGTHREAQISAKKVNKLAKQRRRWENTPACQEKSTLLAQSLSLLNMRVCNCGPELLKNITTEGSDSVPSNQVSFQHFKINSTQRKVFCPHTFWLIHELVFACLPWHWFTFRFGAFFFFFFVLTNQAGCYLRAESTAVGTSNYQGKGKWLFLWWKQDSSARRRKKKNQSRLYCLLTISASWTSPILLKAPTITTLEAHHCSQQDQLVLCATCDCIGKRDKWRELDWNSTSWYLLFTAVFP